MLVDNVYEQEKSLNEYLLFHFGTPTQILPYNFGPSDALDFAVRTVSRGLDVARLPKNARALDLGCAVGRSSFELSRYCEEVIGIDYSQRFIDAAEELKREGSIEVAVLEEGARAKSETLKIPEGVAPQKLRFSQGDAHSIDAEFGSFDVVHAANLLCRMHTPQKLLQRLPSLLNSGGQLVLATPCTWLEEFTPKENWLGAPPHNPQRQTFDAIQESLSEDFELRWRENLPMLIRETSRKFQWTVSECSRWLRK